MSIKITLEKTTALVNKIAIATWVIWSFVSLVLFIGTDTDSPLIYYYLFYILVVTTILVRFRRDLFSPPVFFTLACLVGFGFNIPLIATGFVYGVHIGDATLAKVLIIILTVKISFIIGFLLRIEKVIPTGWIIIKGNYRNDINFVTYILILFCVLIAGIIRIHYHLGEAGIQPTIPYAGYLQYILYDGLLILILWYLAIALMKGKLHVILGLTLLLAIAITQALLAWRGGLIQVLLLAVVLFWYQNKTYQSQKIHSFAWLFILVISASSIMSLGNDIRVQRLGGDSQLVQESFISKMFMRGQGTTRLAKVVDCFGPLTITNNFLIFDLVSNSLTTTKYIDQKIYGVSNLQSNSFGTSGPGGPYTAMGLLGVSISYGLLGSFYKSIYTNMILVNSANGNKFWVILYAILLCQLLGMVNENFNINSFKGIVASVFIVFISTRLNYLKNTVRVRI